MKSYLLRLCCLVGDSEGHWFRGVFVTSGYRQTAGVSPASAGRSTPGKAAWP